MQQHNDMLGNPLQVGELIAQPGRRGSGLWQGLYYVTELKSDGSLRVEDYFTKRTTTLTKFRGSAVRVAPVRTETTPA